MLCIVEHRVRLHWCAETLDSGASRYWFESSVFNNVKKLVKWQLTNMSEAATIHTC
jgi:hypothetical protein